MRVFWQSDARDIPDEAMSYIRVLAVRAIRVRGYSPDLIAEVYGRAADRISCSSIYDWLKRYDEGGYEALETRKAPGAVVTEGVLDRRNEWMQQC